MGGSPFSNNAALEPNPFARSVQPPDGLSPAALKLFKDFVANCPAYVLENAVNVDLLGRYCRLAVQLNICLDAMERFEPHTNEHQTLRNSYKIIDERCLKTLTQLRITPVGRIERTSRTDPILQPMSSNEQLFNDHAPDLLNDTSDSPNPSNTSTPRNVPSAQLIG